MNSIPTVTKNLLIINVLCFFGGVVAMKYGMNLNDLLGLHFFMASDFTDAEFVEVFLSLGLYGDTDHGIGEFHSFEDDGVVLVAESIAGADILETYACALLSS